MTLHILARITMLEAVALLIPFFIALGYRETHTYVGYLVTIGILVAISLPFLIKKPKNTTLRAKNGFMIVALSWVLLSLFGSLPYILSGEIPSFINALFESASGFTTTGSSIVSDPTTLPRSLGFWRVLTQWLGGMGILVLVVAFLPSAEGGSVHLLRAEVPGPQFGRIVSKLRFSARILYGIYVGLTLLQFIFLIAGGMSAFDSVAYALGTASTGGYATSPVGLSQYNSLYFEMVIAVFMLIFSLNFNLFYFAIIGHIRQAVKNEELRVFLGIVFFSTLIIALANFVGGIYQSFGESLRTAFFHTASVSSTTGFATENYTNWHPLAQALLFCLIFVGGSAGSTAGGLKVSRVMLLVKSAFAEMKRLLSPKSVVTIKMDGKPVDREVVASTLHYFVAYMLIIFVSTLLLSVSNTVHGVEGLYVNFSAVISTFNNLGPAYAFGGAAEVYLNFSSFSKLVLIFDMWLGRLEIFPLLLLFHPKLYRN